MVMWPRELEIQYLLNELKTADVLKAEESSLIGCIAVCEHQDQIRQIPGLHDFR